MTQAHCWCSRSKNIADSAEQSQVPSFTRRVWPGETRVLVVKCFSSGATGNLITQDYYLNFLKLLVHNGSLTACAEAHH